jgi:hypothetical protein
MQTSKKVDWLAEQEMMAGLVKLFKEREVNGIVKINIAVCNWQNEGFVTNEDWDITMKYGALISICRKVQNQDLAKENIEVAGDSEEDEESDKNYDFRVKLYLVLVRFINITSRTTILEYFFSLNNLSFFP